MKAFISAVELFLQGSTEIAAWSGEKDFAFDQLTIASRVPGGVSYSQLKLHPPWYPLRGDPRFDKIIASLRPKEGS